MGSSASPEARPSGPAQDPPRLNAYGFTDVENDELHFSYRSDPTYVVQVRINATIMLFFICIISYLSKKLKDVKGVEYFNKYELLGDGLITEE